MLLSVQIVLLSCLSLVLSCLIFGLFTMQFCLCFICLLFGCLLGMCFTCTWQLLVWHTLFVLYVSYLSMTWITISLQDAVPLLTVSLTWHTGACLSGEWLVTCGSWVLIWLTSQGVPPHFSLSHNFTLSNIRITVLHSRGAEVLKSVTTVAVVRVFNRILTAVDVE